MTIREDFEKWAAGFGLDCLRLEGEDEYLIVETRYAWSGWQAATAQRDAEIVRLKAERDAFAQAATEAQAERDAARDERDALLKDAGRYCWLRNALYDGNVDVCEAYISMKVVGGCPDEGQFDAAIDEAMASSSKGGK